MFFLRKIFSPLGIAKLVWQCSRLSKKFLILNSKLNKGFSPFGGNGKGGYKKELRMNNYEL